MKRRYVRHFWNVCRNWPLVLETFLFSVHHPFPYILAQMWRSQSPMTLTLPGVVGFLALCHTLWYPYSYPDLHGCSFVKVVLESLHLESLGIICIVVYKTFELSSAYTNMYERNSPATIDLESQLIRTCIDNHEKCMPTPLSC